MEKTAIIVEYNPFHNGHIKNIKEAKKINKDAYLIVITSGNFTQRGEFSILSKWEKAEIALKYGVDLVVELPFPYQIESADHFAKAALYILNKLEVNNLVFGTESSNLENIKKTAKILNNLNKKDLEKYKKEGKNLKQSIKELFIENNLEIINKPNDLLALSYIKEIEKNNYQIKYFNYKREDNYIESGNNIRNNLNNESLKDLVPIETYKLLKNKKEIDYFKYLKYKILSEGISIKKYLLVDEGIENKIVKEIDKANSLEELIESLKSKRYSYNKIKRMLLFILLGFKKSDKSKNPEYIRVLGFNKNGQKLLKELRNKKDIIIASNIKDSKIFKTEVKTDKLYLYFNNLDLNLYLEKPKKID